MKISLIEKKYYTFFERNRLRRKNLSCKILTSQKFDGFDHKGFVEMYSKIHKKVSLRVYNWSISGIVQQKSLFFSFEHNNFDFYVIQAKFTKHIIFSKRLGLIISNMEYSLIREGLVIKHFLSRRKK